MKLFNSHVHTKYSHDSTEIVENHFANALKNEIFGFAITDHCDCENPTNKELFQKVDLLYSYSENSKKIAPKELIIASGIELGNALFDLDSAERLIKTHNFDVILGSVHSVRMKNNTKAFSKIDFSEKSEVFIEEYLHTYFDDIKEMIEETDIDILSHLTVPIRYISKKYNHKVDMTTYYKEIRNILNLIIKKGITLEINTSNYNADDRFFMPDEDIIDMYIALGGKDFTLGSDAHTSININNGLIEAAKMLKDKGIERLIYYINREKIYYPNK